MLENRNRSRLASLSLGVPLLVAIACAPGCDGELGSHEPVEGASGALGPQRDVDPAGHVPNCGGELSEARVRLSWVDAAAAPEAVVPLRPTLALKVESAARVAVEIAVLGEVHEAGASRRIEITRVALDPGASARVAVKPAGTDLGVGEAAGHLAIWAEVYDREGAVVETSYAPGRSFHRLTDGRSLAVYDDRVREQKYRKGDVHGRMPDELLQNRNVRSIEFHDEAASHPRGEKL
jgi:hypothetical protein